MAEFTPAQDAAKAIGLSFEDFTSTVFDRSGIERLRDSLKELRASGSQDRAQ